MTDKKTFLNWLKKRQNWGVQYFELRTDLLAPQMLQWAQDLIPKEKILLSLRGRLDEFENQMLTSFKFAALDIPLEELRNPTESSKEILLKLLSHCERQSSTLIFSFHNGDLRDLKAILPKVSERAIIKYSPAILTFKELKEAHDWAMENPKGRAFLPRGIGWHWYRLWTKSKFALTFVREGDGPPQGEDQPTIMQWLGTTNYSETPKFSAVLGYPLAHSYSPAIHGDEGVFFDIQIHPDDKFEEALEILKSLGLRRAAVTSPYKEQAARILGGELVSVNTLVYSEELKSWRGTNTDLPALREELLELLKDSGSEAFESKNIQNKICIWGGGGTLAPLRKLLPHAISYSAQRGEPRSEDTGIETAGIETAGIEKGDQFSPAIIIWAARSGSNVKRPPSTWSPQLVFDLNYVESSLGREIARNYGARYISGLNMFRLQAKLQKEFWMSQENDKTSRGESL
jgi:shikimate 5-dehydrogenase